MIKLKHDLSHIRPEKFDNHEFISKRRILIDKVFCSVYSLPLIAQKEHNFRDDVRDKYITFVEKMHDIKGYTQGLKFPLEINGDNEIAWILISLRKPHTAKVYFNVIRLYQKEKNIPIPTYGYNDTNFLPLEYNDTKSLLMEFIKLYLRTVLEIKDIYEYYLKELFNIDVKNFYEGEEKEIKDIVEVSPYQVEIPCEYLGCEDDQFDWMDEEIKCDTVQKYGDLSRTSYYTKNRKDLKATFKRYQKAPGINRHEITLQENWARDCMISDSEMIYQNIITYVHKVHRLWGLDFEGIKPRPINGNVLISQFSMGFGLSTDEIKTMIYGNVGEITSNRENQGIIRKLRNKGMIRKLEKDEGGKKGVYVWTEMVKLLRMSLNQYFLCPECLTRMQYDYENYCHYCSACKKVIRY
ncbi:hypothetical protein [Methanococcus maripaludis]|uniref:Uncharacterized protein n=1 Tax=Methanococcus maripaludis TaxID=39152 RepID=A0A7J9PSA9_METMI|nr:hypothetical protein [Methanococcus maripaludis]MBA2869046.1 hypothetical protein [Methanococcus maripaludis]